MEPKNSASYRQPAPSAQALQTYRTFENLDVDKAAREFRKSMYGVTRQLPAFEKFESGSQGRRVQQVLNGYMSWLRARKQGASLELRDAPTEAFTDDELNELLELVQPVSTFQPFNVSTK